MLLFKKGLTLALFLGLFTFTIHPFHSVLAKEQVFKIKYAKSEQANPLHLEQIDYFHKLIQLALSKTNINYQLKTVRIPADLEQGRSQMLMEQGFYDVHWFTTSAQRESALLPIRIPLFKGLIGFRLMFVHQDNIDMFERLFNVEQLKANYIAGQGRNWPDSDLLKKQNFKIAEATNSDGLLQMLNLKRIDYFPRSILEIWYEKSVIKQRNIEIEPHIALQYPQAVYYFVAKNNHKLHDLIELGLENAIKDGSFDKLFREYFGEYIAKSRLSKRLILHINNPDMTPQTPINRSELWFRE